MTLIYIILAALALGILVFIHELGHLIAAKLMKMKVEVFSIGFGKPILSWNWADVKWQVGWLPFGGYVKIAGMEFGKKEKDQVQDPYKVPEGFFSKSPWQRIFVAIAGPLANLVLALLIFFIIWAVGGREKSYSEFSKIIGWIDPHSELYDFGVRPGDEIKSLNNRPFTTSKELLYVPMLADRKIQVKGEHVNYETHATLPFSYTISSYPSPLYRDGILTTGITSTARYLVYDRFPGGYANPIPEGSPMDKSGIEYGDRLVWADGEILFSLEQMSYILNQQKALLTVKRGPRVFLSRQPRVPTVDLMIPPYMRNELMDWQYEAGLKGRWQDLYILPYNLSADAVVENKIPFIDEDCDHLAFPLQPYSVQLEQPLQPGDRILAIDGIPISTAYQLLDLIQTHHVLLIVKNEKELKKSVSWKQGDTRFINSFDPKEIQKIASTIGTRNTTRISGDYRLLQPVAPKTSDQFATTPEAQEALQKKLAAQREEIAAIRDQKKRALAQQAYEQERNKLYLGLPLQDEQVVFNPSPFSQFFATMQETWQTLKALVTGYLNPKWISGPVGIVQVIHHGWSLGVNEALFWIAVISMNLGLLNLLPIPVLDGGYICLSLWEIITRRRLNPKTIERIIVPFVVLLIALFIFLTFQDIRRLF